MTDAVPLNLISRGIRIRDVTEARIASLMTSIAEVGLLNPITVTPGQVMVINGNTRDGYTLVSGLHRLEAMKRLGHETIPVNVVALSGLAAIIAECDENLCGSNLSTAERALFTKRRKEAYEALHPETKHGAIGNGRAESRQLGDSTSERFTADTAAKTGRSERDIQRDATRGERIAEEVLQEIAGTDLDKGVVLDRIAKAGSAEAQLAAIKKERDVLEAHKRNKETDRAIALTEAEQYAEWLSERTEPKQAPQVITWLQITKPKDVITAFRRIIQ